MLIVHGRIWYSVAMAFIKTTTNREGRIHIYLVEGYRENGKIKHRTLKKSVSYKRWKRKP